MSVPTLRRTFFVAALLLAATALFANNPPALTGSRMAYNESNGYTYMFGGVTTFDAGASAYFNPTETWLWNGLRWLQLFPSHVPAGRSSQVMVYEPSKNAFVMFGGRVGGGTTATDIGDTWIFANGDWTQITTGDAPSPRAFAGAAYDPARGRTVLFGGSNTVPPPIGTAVPPTVTNYYDTWEFDGSTWTKVADNGPQVYTPMLVYDEARSQMLLIGQDIAFKPLMYSYDPGTHAYTQITPQTMPPCANHSAVVFQRAPGTVYLSGGVCVTNTYSSPVLEEAYSWDGTNWTKLVTKSSITKTSDLAMTYDARRSLVVTFGGTQAYAAPVAFTYTFDPSLADATVTPPTNGDWISHDPNTVTPGPRALAAFQADPVNKVIYLLGGNTDGTTFTDFWTYQNGGWARITADNTPACGTPYAAFDTDRSKLVVACSDGTIAEWDGSAWKTFPDLKTKPSFTRFAAMVYDPTLKRTVLYGGYNDSDYVNNTWEWDGTAWTELRKHNAPSRAMTAMWYDPILKKTVLFGGVGRPSAQDAVERYDDMWGLDNTNGWTEMKPGVLPNTRYGAQIATDPNTGHTFLLGGLRLDSEIKNGNTLYHQVYADDMWEWDGSKWTQVAMNNTPGPRESGAFAYDYGRNEFVLFGGWSGYYHGDLWRLTGSEWHIVPESMKRGRISTPKH